MNSRFIRIIREIAPENQAALRGIQPDGNLLLLIYANDPVFPGIVDCMRAASRKDHCSFIGLSGFVYHIPEVFFCFIMIYTDPDAFW